MSHMNLHILNWGHESEKLDLLQKKAIRAVFNAHYIAHTSPLFVAARAVRIRDIHRLAIVKFFFKFKRNILPSYFLNLDIKTNASLQGAPINTRNRNDLATPSAAKDSLPYLTCHIIKSLPMDLRTIIDTLSLNSVIRRVKKHFLDSYETVCGIAGCYACAAAR